MIQVQPYLKLYINEDKMRNGDGVGCDGITFMKYATTTKKDA